LNLPYSGSNDLSAGFAAGSPKGSCAFISQDDGISNVLATSAQLSGYSVARMHQALLSPMLSIQQTVSYHLSLLHAPAYWQHILKLLHNIHIFVEQYCSVTITEHPAYLLACLLKLGFITCMRQQHRLNDIPKATATFTQE
jgi:hypothetical protein